MLRKLLFSYKPEQGLVVRGTAVAALAALYLFGCVGLYYTLLNWGDVFAQPVAGLTIPVLDQPLNGALFASLAVFLLLLFVSARILNRPKTAELLIETEAEVNKVTWPSWTETVSASMVVIFTTLFLAALMFVFDYVLSWATKLVLL